MYGNKGFYGQNRFAARLGYIYLHASYARGGILAKVGHTRTQIFTLLQTEQEGMESVGTGWVGGTSAFFLYVFFTAITRRRLPCSKAFAGLGCQLPDMHLTIAKSW